MRNFVLKLAREAIETYVKTGKKISAPAEYPKELDEKKGVFVTIYKKPKELRGCVGFPYPQLPVIRGLVEAAIEASKDPRFSPLSKEELKDIWIEVSILSTPKLIEVKSQKDCLKKINAGKDGLILQKGYCSGLLLPQVWEEIPEKEDFLEALCMKAGLLADEWLDSSTKIYKFEVQSFKEC
jgi:AmmeMemoRadiSam system protein A